MDNSNEVISQAIPVMSEKEGKYLTFSLGNEEYGIGILKIREIIGIMAVTSVPQTPEFVKGVINLRGKVIPIVDLRLRFDMDAIEYTERTCIIVVDIETDGMTFLIGVVVDSVSEVINIKAAAIEDSPTFDPKLDNNYIMGVAKLEDGVKILLDIDRIFGTIEPTHLCQAA